MDRRDAKVGLEVYIRDDISITTSRHSSGPQMIDMCGSEKKYHISEVSSGGKIVRINSWTWAVEDVFPCDCLGIEIKQQMFNPKTKPQMFNPENL